MAYEIILADVDYTTVPLHEEWLRRYNIDWNDDLSTEDVTKWNIASFVRPECGDKIYEYLLDIDLYDNLVIPDRVINSIQYLRDEKFRVVFLTGGIHIGKYNLLKKYNLVDSQADMIIAKDKSLIRGDIMVDDYQANLYDYYKHNNGLGILFDAPHNRGIRVFPRVSSWTEAVVLIMNKYR